MEAFMGTINTFGFQFAPKNWMLCQGQLIAISQNTALFALLGTTYGGNGQTTFALPDLRGRFPISQGQGPGLTDYVMGEVTGSENTTLLINNLPTHSHSLVGTAVAATDTAPTNALILGAPNGEDSNLGAVTVKMYAPAASAPAPLAPAQSVGFSGGSNPTPILQPILVINTSICVAGLFPSRN